MTVHHMCIPQNIYARGRYVSQGDGNKQLSNVVPVYILVRTEGHILIVYAMLFTLTNSTE